MHCPVLFSNKSGSGQKVCGGGGGWVVVETYYSVKLKLKLKLNKMSHYFISLW